MTAPESDRHLIADQGQPLIGVPLDGGDLCTVGYFTTEHEADQALETGPDEALALAGAWGDLPWKDMAGELDRIRHENEPSPPLSL